MLSNHFQDGMETARLLWSRVPSSEDGEFDGIGISKKSDSSGVESLDYEVIENYAYREEQEKRGKLFVGYQVVLKWFLALLIGIAIAVKKSYTQIKEEESVVMKLESVSKKKEWR